MQALRKALPPIATHRLINLITTAAAVVMHMAPVIKQPTLQEVVYFVGLLNTKSPLMLRSVLCRETACWVAVTILEPFAPCRYAIRLILELAADEAIRPVLVTAKAVQLLSKWNAVLLDAHAIGASGHREGLCESQVIPWFHNAHLQCLCRCHV